MSENSASSNIQLNNYFRSEHDNQREHTWSAAIEEANALAHLPKEINSCTRIYDTLQRRDIKRGVSRGRAKLKFSFRSLSHKDDFSSSSLLKDGNEVSYVNKADDLAFHNKLEDRTKEISIVEFQEESGELPPDAVSHEKIRAGSSMAKLLEDLQEENGLSARPSNLMLQDAKPKERKMQSVGKRGLSHLGYRILDNEDPPEFKGDGLSSEDEDIGHNQLCIVSQRDEGRTMADLFQEAFSRSEAEGFQFPTGKQSGLGYHGRLQQILQVEKDRHLELLKYSKPGYSPSNDLGSMDVQILSRFLEAKLTVCQCSYRENTNISQYGKSAQKSEHDGGTVKRKLFSVQKYAIMWSLKLGILFVSFRHGRKS
ncbi:Uncharacterized protein M6B38_237875 [Iris pallida]|uniref:Uncharacterized protein n=1 Tax=Iris pallida TaxID=29817 RepID=A0AAX6DMB9_IRIPA|nr:Uncharacterized protein M6B38_237875 [Iris pallida]